MRVTSTDNDRLSAAVTRNGSLKVSARVEWRGQVAGIAARATCSVIGMAFGARTARCSGLRRAPVDAHGDWDVVRTHGLPLLRGYNCIENSRSLARYCVQVSASVTYEYVTVRKEFGASPQAVWLTLRDAQACSGGSDWTRVPSLRMRQRTI